MKNKNYSTESKKILFTIWYADGFHGAVMHVSEIGEYLASKGWDVYCTGVYLTDSIKNYFSTKGIKAIPLKFFDYSIEYDIIWNLHFPIFPFLLKNNLKYRKIIYNSLSAYLEIESPPQFHEEYPIILAVSEETKNRIVNYYNVPSEKVQILRNVVPLNYFEQQKIYNKSVKKVVIVSNHVPKELLDCVDLFKERGIDCDIIGKKHNCLCISPQVLLPYDVVITIGKTVQYALAMGIPCYNYDRFGGSGYINENNYKIEEYYNFSGRSFKTQKTSIEIVSEIIDQYDTSLENTEKLKDIAKERYSISAQIDPIIKYVDNIPDTKINLQKNLIIIDQYYFLLNTILKSFAKKKPAKNKKKKKSILKTLLSVQNEYSGNYKHKVICFLGIKLKFKCT